MVMFYLLIAGICKEKSRLVTFWIKCLFITFTFFVTTNFMSRDASRKVIIFLSNFPWHDLVFPWFSSTDHWPSCRLPYLSGTQLYLVFSNWGFVWGSPFSWKYFCASGTWFYLGFSIQSHLSGLLKCSIRLQNPSMLTSFENSLSPWIWAFLVVSNTTK